MQIWKVVKVKISTQPFVQPDTKNCPLYGYNNLLEFSCQIDSFVSPLIQIIDIKYLILFGLASDCLAWMHGNMTFRTATDLPIKMFTLTRSHVKDINK